MCAMTSKDVLKNCQIKRVMRAKSIFLYKKRKSQKSQKITNERKNEGSVKSPKHLKSMPLEPQKNFKNKKFQRVYKKEYLMSLKRKES